MTILELLVWILIAIVAFYVLKLSLTILIIIISIIVIYYIVRFFTKPSYENYKSMPIEYSNPHFGFPDLSRPKCINNIPNAQTNYLYIPIHQYLKDTPMKSISEYCVQQHINQYHDLNSAIEKCHLDNPISTNIN